MDNNDKREETLDQKYNIQPYNEEERSFSRQVKYLEEEPEEEIHLRDYLNVILKRKWIVILTLVTIVVTVTFATLLAKPMFKSTVTIKIDKENPNVLTFKDIYQAEAYDQNYYQTQYSILKSRSIVKKVIDKLQLYRYPEFMPDQSKGASQDKNMIFRLFSSEASKQKDKKKNNIINSRLKISEKKDDLAQKLINNVLSRFEVSPIRNSQLVELSFIAYDPRLSQKVANQFADTYIEFNLDSKLDATLEARKWLEKQIGAIRAKLEATEEKLNQYSAGYEMIYIEESKDNVNPIIQKLAELSNASSQATTERIKKEAIYNEILETGTASSVFLNNSLIQSLEERHANLSGEYFKLLKTFKPDYPKMQSLKSQMDEIRRKIDEEKIKVIKSIKSDYNAIVKREQYLKETFNNQKKKVLDFQKKSVQYQILKREVDTNKELYNSLLQRLKEIGISATLTATNIQIIDKAELPRVPFKPKKTRNILMAIIVGLFAGIGLVFFIEYFDNTIKDTQFIESKMQLPTLGMIPFHKDVESSKERKLIVSGIKNPLAEAFRSIGTFIQLSSASKPPKIILLTSASEKEGKTTTSINTALALTESKGKGIIIDADLRKSRLHQTFKVNNLIGLSTFLTGNIEFGIELMKPTLKENLYVIPAGPPPPNPSELLGSDRMIELIDALCCLYDFVIIDSPPILGMTDSVYLSKLADGVILVAKAGYTPRDALMEAKKILKHVNAKILGVVLNGIRESDVRYGYYSYYYSSYYK